MNVEEIIDLLGRGIFDLLDNDNELIENRAREESINHRLGIYIEHHLKLDLKETNPYNVDTEYDKNFDEKKKIMKNGKLTEIRPDIIIHKRNSNDYNLLAIEAKKDRGNNTEDYEKIIGLLNIPYEYDFGSLIDYNPRKDNVTVKISYINKIDNSIIDNDYEINKEKRTITKRGE